jgi:hypothetical protein
MTDDRGHSPTHARKKQRMSRKDTRPDRRAWLAGLRLARSRVYTDCVFRHWHRADNKSPPRGQMAWLLAFSSGLQIIDLGTRADAPFIRLAGTPDVPGHSDRILDHGGSSRLGTGGLARNA